LNRVAGAFSEHIRRRFVPHQLDMRLIQDLPTRQPWSGAHPFIPRHVENLAAWLTRVVARVCLDMLRSRALRREELVGLQVAEDDQQRAHNDSSLPSSISNGPAHTFVTRLQTENCRSSPGVLNIGFRESKVLPRGRRSLSTSSAGLRRTGTEPQLALTPPGAT
jgi:hypothetical protein